VCHGLSPRSAIREALGQIIEYNLYGDETHADEWWIVIDEQPGPDDERYVMLLRRKYALPLFLVCPAKNGAAFVVAR
jgi:hypothetical protein